MDKNKDRECFDAPQRHLYRRLGHHLLTLFHTTGVTYVNVQLAIFAMNHLYAAGRRRTFLMSGNAVPFLWHDMLVMQKSQGEDKRFWVGLCPEDMAELWNH
jgi:hypothetical protein